MSIPKRRAIDERTWSASSFSPSISLLLRTSEVSVCRTASCWRSSPSVDLPPFLTQPVKTQNPSKGELSHGVVEKDVHQGVQAGCGAAAGTREFDRRGSPRAGGESERAAPLAA